MTTKYKPKTNSPWVKVATVRRKKDKENEGAFLNENFLKVENDVTLKAGMFMNLKKKPTKADIENAASEQQANFLTKQLENWPDWLVANIEVNLDQEIREYTKPSTSND